MNRSIIEIFPRNPLIEATITTNRLIPVTRRLGVPHAGRWITMPLRQVMAHCKYELLTQWFVFQSHRASHRHDCMPEHESRQQQEQDHLL